MVLQIMKQTAPHRWNHVCCLPPLCWLLNPPQSNVHCSVCQYWHLHFQAHPIPHRQHTYNIFNTKGHPNPKKSRCSLPPWTAPKPSTCGVCVGDACALRWGATRIAKTDSRRWPWPNQDEFLLATKACSFRRGGRARRTHWNNGACLGLGRCFRLPKLFTFSCFPR